jgi:hypothetical protein
MKYKMIECESCKKIFRQSDLIDISVDEGIMMCKKCYDFYNKYQEEKERMNEHDQVYN